MGSVSGSFFSRAVGRSLICQIKAGAQGLGGLLGALDLYSFVMEGGEREEQDLIGRRVLAERRTASKIPEGLNIGTSNHLPFCLRKLVRSDKILKFLNSDQRFWLSSLYRGQI